MRIPRLFNFKSSSTQESDVTPTTPAQGSRGTPVLASRGTQVQDTRGNQGQASRGSQVQDSRGTQVQASRGTQVQDSSRSQVPESRGGQVQDNRGSQVQESRGTQLAKVALLSSICDFMYEKQQLNEAFREKDAEKVTSHNTKLHRHYEEVKDHATEVVGPRYGEPLVAVCKGFMEEMRSKLIQFRSSTPKNDGVVYVNPPYTYENGYFELWRRH